MKNDEISNQPGRDNHQSEDRRNQRAFEARGAERGTDCRQSCHNGNEESVKTEEQQDSGTNAHANQCIPFFVGGELNQKIEKENHKKGREAFRSDLGGEEKKGWSADSDSEGRPFGLFVPELTRGLGANPRG